MKRRKFVERSVQVVGGGAIATLIGSATSCRQRAPQSVILTISAATSLQDVMVELLSLFQDDFPQISITLNAGASGALAQQIAQGAPADVFLSASQDWMNRLEQQGQLLSRRDLLQNAMVLIRPQSQPPIQDFAALATDAVRKIAVGEPESVPAGRYAKEILVAMDLWDALQPKLVFSKDTRQALTYVMTGDVDAGLVYKTDALTSDRVQVMATAPAATHSPIVYSVAAVSNRNQPPQQKTIAQTFVDFLATEAAIARFQSYGFEEITV